MKIFFQFPSGAEPSALSAISAVSVFSSAGSLDAVYTPTCIGNLGNDFSTTVTAGDALSAAYRQFYFEFPVATSANTFKSGVYSFFVDGGSGVSDTANRYIVGTINTVEEARKVDQLLKIQTILAALTGTEVINTTLNERVVYNATINANGAVVDDKASILMRFKLYDAFGQSTSVNPVESRVFNSLVNSYISTVLSSISGILV